MTKTKKCNWCNKRKKVEAMYHLGVFKGKVVVETDNGELEIVECKDNTDYWICNECNLKEDVI